MKTLIILVWLIPLLSSCFTNKSLVKRGEPITVDVVSKMQPQKMHWIRIRTGQEFKLYVTRIDSAKVFGEVHEKDSLGFITKHPYEDTFINLQKNATKIRVHKFDPIKTTTVIAVPILLGIIAGNMAASPTP